MIEGDCSWRRRTGAGPDGLERAEALIDAGADVIVMDTAHGHSEGVLETVSAVRKLPIKFKLLVVMWPQPEAQKR